MRRLASGLAQGGTLSLSIWALALPSCQEPNPAYQGVAELNPQQDGASFEGPKESALPLVDASADQARDAVGATALPCPGDPDLIACFRFEGDLSDESPVRSSVTSSSEAFEFGPDGRALSMTRDARVKVLDSPGLRVSQVTLQVWVKPRSLPATDERAGIVDYQPQYSMFLRPGGDIECRTNGPNVLASGVVTAGRWTSLACVADGSTLSLWVDGEMRATAPGAALSIWGPGDMVIGGNFPSDDRVDPDPLDGLLDNLRVWRRILSPSEIRAAVVTQP